VQNHSQHTFFDLKTLAIKQCTIRNSYFEVLSLIIGLHIYLANQEDPHYFGYSDRCCGEEGSNFDFLGGGGTG